MSSDPIVLQGLAVARYQDRYCVVMPVKSPDVTVYARAIAIALKRAFARLRYSRRVVPANNFVWWSAGVHSGWVKASREQTARTMEWAAGLQRRPLHRIDPIAEFRSWRENMDILPDTLVPASVQEQATIAATESLCL